MKIFAVVFLTVMIFVGSYLLLVKNFSHQEIIQTRKNYGLFAHTIEDELQQLEHLPFAIPQNATVIDALVNSNGAALNPVLKRFSERANADHIFLLDLNGLTIAASNYERPDSFIGKSYTFRPYFRDALIGAEFTLWLPISENSE